MRPIFSDFWTFLYINSTDLLLLKSVLFYKCFYSTIRQEYWASATITGRNSPAIWLYAQNISHKSSRMWPHNVLMCENIAFDLYAFFSKVYSQIWIALHISTLSHTLYVSRWEKVGAFGKGGLWRKRQGVHRTDPCWAGCSLVSVQGAWHAWPCTELTEIKTCEWWVRVGRAREAL